MNDDPQSPDDVFEQVRQRNASDLINLRSDVKSLEVQLEAQTIMLKSVWIDGRTVELPLPVETFNRGSAIGKLFDTLQALTLEESLTSVQLAHRAGVRYQTVNEHGCDPRLAKFKFKPRGVQKLSWVHPSTKDRLTKWN